MIGLIILHVDIYIQNKWTAVIVHYNIVFVISEFVVLLFWLMINWQAFIFMLALSKY